MLGDTHRKQGHILPHENGRESPELRTGLKQFAFSGSQADLNGMKNSALKEGHRNQGKLHRVHTHL